MKNIYLFALSFAALAILPSCETIKPAGDYLQENETLTRAAVEYATLKYINEDSGKSQRVQDVITKTIAVMNGGQSTTIESIATFVRQNVSVESLSPTEFVLLNALIDVVQSEIQKRISRQALDENDRVFVARVLTWIHDAAARSNVSK